MRCHFLLLETSSFTKRTSLQGDSILLPQIWDIFLICHLFRPRKFRVAMRVIHRAPFVHAKDLFLLTTEDPLEKYVQRYISKRLKNMYLSDLRFSLFLEDIFFWASFTKRKEDGTGHFFSLRRVKRMKEQHQPLLISWIEFGSGQSN